MSGFDGPAPDNVSEEIGRQSEVLVDLDSARASERARLLTKFASDYGYLPVMRVETWPSRNRGEHMRIVLEQDLSLIERVSWSIVLGGDVLHGIFSMARGFQRLFRPLGEDGYRDETTVEGFWGVKRD